VLDPRRASGSTSARATGRGAIGARSPRRARPRVALRRSTPRSAASRCCRRRRPRRRRSARPRSSTRPGLGARRRRGCAPADDVRSPRRSGDATRWPPSRVRRRRSRRRADYLDAIHEALREEMERDRRWSCSARTSRPSRAPSGSRALAARWPERVLDTPISESGTLGLARRCAARPGAVSRCSSRTSSPAASTRSSTSREFFYRFERPARWWCDCRGRRGGRRRLPLAEPDRGSRTSPAQGGLPATAADAKGC